MSLYYDAATVLSGSTQEDSFKSRIYGNKLELKSKPAHLYALISETAKYNHFLKEVIDNAAFLSHESKLTPILSLLLVHDHLFAKGGIAAPSGHTLRRAVEKHKARLQAEFTKARLRRKCATVQDLKALLLREHPPAQRSQPRWIRVNALKSSLSDQLATTFKGYRTDATISEVARSFGATKVLAMDPNIPDLLALAPDADFTKTNAYTDGKLILQDKASCFPAYLLAGDNDSAPNDCIDGCAAPGNKTSHLAALISGSSTIYACERDGRRSKILQSMIEKSGASNVNVLSAQDFLSIDPQHARYKHVTHLLLDPSCSGSGIVGREDVPKLILPTDPRMQKVTTEKGSKKRKRDQQDRTETEVLDEEVEAEETRDTTTDATRLQKLSTIQAKLVEHAFAFPAATRITYSTCSVHVEENELVVSRLLSSAVARTRGWGVLRRQNQVAGLREWKHRGLVDAGSKLAELGAELLTPQDLDACIRCHPGGDDGTMGFFVCGFVRSTGDISGEDGNHNQADGDAWDGFSD
ncbi:NOL1/NOP2/sun domain-containing protein [Exophiala viscosa]|uniref:NOL1/NOP2/sun domain-containing protein n=1 Tax=Exophiala viscosa TaxID=2486360 RepID=A0AAN6DM81_9EURO|nr:NOL1/NOP2/sun domain-containing protein [Exophiala viscosa]